MYDVFIAVCRKKVKSFMLNKMNFSDNMAFMIWVIGNSGMLGSEVCRLLEKNKIRYIGSSSSTDIRDYNALKSFAADWETANYINAHKNGNDARIKWIVNCSGYTAVEKAEKDKAACAALNVTGAANIARCARELGAKLIHISTDYVFNGKADSPYKESDAKAPLGVYGETKSRGEDEIQKLMTQFFILRTSWLYGAGRPNFVYTMAGLMQNRTEIKVVNDQTGSPTWTADLAEAILLLIKNSEKAGTDIFNREAAPYGIYNFAGSGATTWFDFALEIQRLLKKYRHTGGQCRIEPCSTEEYGAKVERPGYSVLCTDKIAGALKIKIPKWQLSLEKFIKSPDFKIPEN